MKECEEKKIVNSDVARAFPGGWLAHLEGQNEDKNEETFSEKKKKKKMTEIWRKTKKVECPPPLAHPGLRGWLRYA